MSYIKSEQRFTFTVDGYSVSRSFSGFDFEYSSGYYLGVLVSWTKSATVKLNSAYYCVNPNSHSLDFPGKSCPLGYKTSELTDFTQAGNGANASIKLINNGATLVGALYNSSKFAFENDFKVIFTIKVLDITSTIIDGLSLVITNSIFCDTSKGEGNLGYDGYTEGAVIGEFDWRQNAGDISAMSISIHDCLNSVCTSAENSDSTQLKMSDSVSF